MPEQQQDVDGEQHTQSSVLIEKKPISISTHTTKLHKVKHRRKRHNKYPSPQTTPQAVDNSNTHIVTNTPSGIEEGSMLETMVDTPQSSSTEEMEETSVAVTEMDVETDPAVPAIAKKKTPVEPFVPITPAVPTTPAVVEEADDTRSSWRQGDRKSLPYIFAVALRVGETFTKGQGRPQGDAPPIDETASHHITSYGRGVPLRAPLHHRRLFSWHRILTYAFLALLLTNTVLLWQDLTATHLYVNTLNASNGSLRTQQDLGGYHNAIRLTTPLAVNTNPASAVLGVYAPGQGGAQQLLTLHRTSSSLSLQRSVSLANGAITQDAHGRLLVEGADGLQVVTQDGQVIWHMQGQQPTRGIHPFTPTSDTEVVYTIASVTHSQVAAYTFTNGHRRWIQTLPDTLEYAPPFLLDGDTLYIASDHNVFALNSSDGSVRWEKPYAARTLLVEDVGQQHLLLALGPQGIQALQSNTGEVTWIFRGNPAVSTLPTQFYQGTIGSIAGVNNNVVYATGVVWRMPSVREDVWLYAIDATTGTMRWSQQIASGPTGVDVGRVLQPLLDTENGMVLVQRAIQMNENAVTAYDAQTGRQRWNTPIVEMNTSSPIVFQLSKNIFAVFTTTTNSTTILWTPSFYRTCLLLLLLVGILGLLLLLFLLRVQGSDKPGRPQGDAPPIRREYGERRFVYGRGVPLRAPWSPFIPLSSRLWHLPYTFALALLCVCIGISIFVYTHSSQPAHAVLATDAQGSIVTTSTGDTLHQLEALTPNGTRQWTLFSSEGVFSVPKAQTQAGTLLVALHGDTTHSYSVAGDDPAYPRPLDHMLALYLLDRTTGHIMWQQVVSYPDEQQTTEIIGVDATYIYVAGEHTLTGSAHTDANSVRVPQLFAVNKLTGTVDWRVFGPTLLASKQSNPSTLLIKNGLVLWHVANTVFTIDANVGQIIARK